MMLTARGLLFLFCFGTIAAFAQGPATPVPPTVLCTVSGKPATGRPPGRMPAGKFEHVIVIFQENRTPDNLFHDLAPKCSPKSPVGPTNCYDIATEGLGKGGSLITLEPIRLNNAYDLDHSHTGWADMCDLTSPSTCAMDGAYSVKDTCGTNTSATCCTTCPNPACPGADLSYKYVDNSCKEVEPYIQVAENYGWGNCMFQGNQGPSYPAHQFIFGGTSAPSKKGLPNPDAKGIFISENPGAPKTAPYSATDDTGCLAPVGETQTEITSAGEAPYNVTKPGVLCFDRLTLGDLLTGKIKPVPPDLAWKYYTMNIPGPGGHPPANPVPPRGGTPPYNQMGSIWTAPASISGLCGPDSKYTDCLGPAFKGSPGPPPTPANVDLTQADIFNDISQCHLAPVSWVIPDGSWSDHAKVNNGWGPYWVADIVNAIGQGMKGSICNPLGTPLYWSNTAIIITWDDWGGWYDHEPPVILTAQPQGDYQYGFRVPLLVVSAHTPPSKSSLPPPPFLVKADPYVHEFGSILRFIEANFGIEEGKLGYTDARDAYGPFTSIAPDQDDLHEFFDFTATRTFTPITVPTGFGPTFFLKYKGVATAPDDD